VAHRRKSQCGDSVDADDQSEYARWHRRRASKKKLNEAASPRRRLGIPGITQSSLGAPFTQPEFQPHSAIVRGFASRNAYSPGLSAEKAKGSCNK
jgi:hypothetical protein